MKIIYSQKCTKYFEEEDFETPERVKSTYELLSKNGFEFLDVIPATKEDILRVHSKELFNAVKTRGNQNRECLDYNINMKSLETLFESAMLSAGAAAIALELCSKEDVFSLMRPPGHHASKNKAEGFCFFNNMAVSVKKALDIGMVKKIAILDIDLHHGNGTQDIFLEDDRVLFISLHQSPEYPHSGLVSEKNCINYPLPPGTSEEIYLKNLSNAIEKIKEFNPDIIGVSAGFDTYKEEIIGESGSFKLEIESYEKIARMIKEIGKPVFSILEGGYTSKLSECVLSYLKGFD